MADSLRFLWTACLIVGAFSSAQAAASPNIVVILADDLGYGDVKCYNPDRCQCATPHMDRLASEGMRFTDAHSSSGVCSPTRYSLLTGRYHWRTRLQAGIVGVWGKPLVARDRWTIGTLAQRAGYHTACVGKWHLGRDWPYSEEELATLTGFGGRAGGGGKVTDVASPEQIAAWREMFARPIPNGPTERGFNTYFGTDVPNWPPYCFIENDRTVGIPSTLLPADQFVKNLASLQGPAIPDWQLDAILPALVDRACSIVAAQAAAMKPFLLYVPLTSPHTPIAPSKEFVGSSKLGRYGDLVQETDAAVGRMLQAIDDAGLRSNTLVVATSDNGFAPYVGAATLEAAGHFPSGPWRGYKADAWEGGHRVPFLVRWPGVVAAGSVCEQTICSVDLMATFAEAMQQPLPENMAEDSVSIMPLLKGESRPIHEMVVHHSASGVFAVRSGPWKLILGAPSGPAKPAPHRLYRLDNDPAESTNLADEHPEVVKQLARQFREMIDRGRSTPGPQQANDVAIPWETRLSAPLP